jgi:hypothetical protein
MHHKRLEPDFVNRIAAYIDATNVDLEELHRNVRPAAFARRSTHVWTHVACLRRRLKVLEARAVRESEH